MARQTKKNRPITKFQKIRNEILIPILSILVVSVMLLMLISGQAASMNTVKTLDKNMTALAKILSDKIQIQLENYEFALQSLVTSNALSSAYSDIRIQLALDNAAKEYGFLYLKRTDSHGTVLGSRDSIQEESYYQITKNEKRGAISDITESEDHQRVFVVSYPITQDGRFDGIVFGAVSDKALTEIINKAVIGKTGGAFLLDAKGNTIASTVSSQIGENIQQQTQSAKGLAKLSALESAMCLGSTGFGNYRYEGRSKLLAYAPIQGINGWSMGITAERSEYMGSVTLSMIVISGIAAAILLFTGFFIRYMANKISKPLEAVGLQLQSFSKGDFSLPMPYRPDQTEIGQLIGSITDSKDYLQAVIRDLARGCTEMARGNFDISPGVSYVGEFEAIHNALVKIITSMGDTLSQIHISAQQVSIGSDQVSSGAQVIAQSATEQASSIEGLSTQISTINDHVNKNAAMTDQVNSGTLSVGEKIKHCNEDMQQLNQAMIRIRDASEKIGKIIKTIDDIAFQTNILALNAAVEAARAGQAGKGFSVVADEVRNLANRSADAAKNTSELIAEAVRTVENGTKLASSTAESLSIAASGTEELMLQVKQIADATNIQAEEISKITAGIDQITSAVQTNSAASEQSAATSEELSGQAVILQDLLNHFKIKNGTQDLDIPSNMAACPRAHDADKY